MKMHLTAAAALLAGLICGGPATAQAADTTPLLNPNTAKVEELRTLPHLNAQLAQAIVAGRPYATTAAMNDMLAKSLSEAQRAELYPRLFLPINLNSSTRDEIMLIPGMSARMAREFLEYRPYANIEQFRREIGKYVDAKEVARLERYVMLK
jgi:DNA uptake protein ComE-like DNA-binding protein